MMHAETKIARDVPLFIVLNAGSGRGDPMNRLSTIQGVLRDAGQRHEILVVDVPRQVTVQARRAVELAQQQGGVVVAAGGDGTINSVAQLVLGAGLPFGILPQGTFNYFSRTHGIPLDTAQATRALLASAVQPVQVGLINHRVFLVNASLGFYPQLLEDREAYKKRFGRSRIVALWAGIMTIAREHRQLVLELEKEGEIRIMRTATLVAGNNRFQLEQIGIPEAVALHNAQLVAIAVRPLSKLGMFGLLLRGAIGQLGDAENVVSFAFKRLTVRLLRRFRRRRIKIAADGEVDWVDLPVVFQVSPTPLLLLTPGPVEETPA
jgi:diacylglycerol kinase family enzyme